MTRPALVLVHGRGQAGFDAAMLQTGWLGALRDGLGPERAKVLDGIEVRFPFYGRVLDEVVASTAAGLPGEALAKGDASEADPDFLIFQQIVLERIAEAVGVTPPDVQRELTAEPGEKGPGSWRWVQALLRALDRIPGVSAEMLSVVFRDVYAYLTIDRVRRAIDGLVAPAIAGRCVVVGHSLGSVVTYRILKQMSAGADIPLYCTIGSCLGLAGVRENVMPLVFPAGVAAWFNAFDRRDVVALQALDRTLYPLKPPIENDGSLRNSTEDHHGIAGYLNQNAIADRLYAALTA